MIKIEQAIVNEFAMRGIIYLRNDASGAYEDEIGELYVFNDEGNHFYAFLYLSESQREHLHLTDKAALDDLGLNEKIKDFIGTVRYLTEPPKLTMDISYLSNRPTLIYES